MAKTIYHTKRPVLLKMKPCIIGLFTYSRQRILLLHTHYKLFSLTTLYLHSYKTLTTYTTQQHTAQASLYSTLQYYITLPPSLSLSHHTQNTTTITKLPSYPYTQALSIYLHSLHTHSLTSHPSITYIYYKLIVMSPL